MIRFKTFSPYTEYDNQRRHIEYSATAQVNEWLAENQDVEIISWQTTAVGNKQELHITIQYKENQ